MNPLIARMIMEEYPFTDDSPTVPPPAGPKPTATPAGEVDDTHATEPSSAPGTPFKGSRGGVQTQRRKISTDFTGAPKVTPQNPQGIDARKNMTIDPGTVSSAGGQFSAKMSSVMPNIAGKNELTDPRTGRTIKPQGVIDPETGTFKKRGIYVDGVKQEVSGAPAIAPSFQGTGATGSQRNEDGSETYTHGDKGSATVGLKSGRKAAGIYVPTAMDQSPDNWQPVGGANSPAPAGAQAPTQVAGVPAKEPTEQQLNKRSDALGNVLDKALAGGSRQAAAKPAPAIPDEEEKGKKAVESAQGPLYSFVESLQ